MRPYVVLDVDGTIAPLAKGGDPFLGPWSSIDISCVARLNRIVLSTGAGVVLSSSRRLGVGLGAIQRGLEARGFEGMVHGALGSLSVNGSFYESDRRRRPWEIAAWAWCYGIPERLLVLLDDERAPYARWAEAHGSAAARVGPLAYDLHDRLVHVDCRVGLSELDASRAIAMLGSDSRAGKGREDRP